jgi:hypothetical protein
MPRLQVQPRGLFPDISFGREPSNSTGGTFTHVAAGFPGAHPNPADLTTIKHRGRGEKEQPKVGPKGEGVGTSESKHTEITEDE